MAFHQRPVPSPMTALGWKSVGMLELTALPSIDKERWVSWVREADALLVNGGDALYLCHWMRESGLAGLFPSLRDTVYVGAQRREHGPDPRIKEGFADWKPPTGSCRFLHLPPPRQPGLPGQHHGRGGTVGRQDKGPGIRRRRSNRH